MSPPVIFGKYLVDRAELERLRLIEKAYEELQKKSGGQGPLESEQTGSGNSDESHATLSALAAEVKKIRRILQENNLDQCHEHENILQTRQCESINGPHQAALLEPIVNTVESGEAEKSTTVFVEQPSQVSITALLEQLPPRIRGPAEQVIGKINQGPETGIKFDSAGLVYMNGKVLNHAKIADLLKATFKKFSKKKVVALAEWSKGMSLIGQKVASMPDGFNDDLSVDPEGDKGIIKAWYYVGQ
jgi:hypothetical protein